MDRDETELKAQLMCAIKDEDDLEKALLNVALGYSPKKVIDINKITDKHRVYKTRLATLCLPEDSWNDKTNRIDDSVAMAIFYWLAKHSTWMEIAFANDIMHIESEYFRD